MGKIPETEKRKLPEPEKIVPETSGRLKIHYSVEHSIQIYKNNEYPSLLFFSVW